MRLLERLRFTSHRSSLRPMTKSLGVDVDTGEVVFVDDEMREMLRHARNPPYPKDQPGFSFGGEHEKPDHLAVDAFLGLSDAEKTAYLNAVPAEEAAHVLIWADAPL